MQLRPFRRIALNIVRLMDDEPSIAGRMDIAGWNDKYLVGLFVNAVGKFLKALPVIPPKETYLHTDSHPTGRHGSGLSARRPCPYGT